MNEINTKRIEFEGIQLFYMGAIYKKIHKHQILVTLDTAYKTYLNGYLCLLQKR